MNNSTIDTQTQLCMFQEDENKTEEQQGHQYTRHALEGHSTSVHHEKIKLFTSTLSYDKCVHAPAPAPTGVENKTECDPSQCSLPNCVMHIIKSLGITIQFVSP